MPWVKAGDRYSGGTDWGRLLLTILIFLLIGALVLVTMGNRDAIERVESRFDAIGGELAAATAETRDLRERVASLGWSSDNDEETEALRRDIAETGARLEALDGRLSSLGVRLETLAPRSELDATGRQIGAVRDRLETLAAQSVDIESMQAFRQEILQMRAQLAGVETRLSGMEASTRTGGTVISDFLPADVQGSNGTTILEVQ